MKTVRIIGRILIYLLALILAFIAIFPLLWSIVTSFKTPSQTYAWPPVIIPHPFTWQNYGTVLFSSTMVRMFENTAITAFFSTIVSGVVSLLAAYGFSRFKFPGKNFLFGSILFSRLLPRVTLLIPFYIILAKLGLINHKGGLVLVYLMVAMPITVWMLRGYVDTVPFEIEEAAIVDGCGTFGVLFRIVVPMLAPAIVAVSMYAFILAWNEFLMPLLFTKDITSRTISVGLAFYIDDSGVQYGPMMAASVMMSIPPIIVFSYAQKYIVKGLSEGAVKG